MVAQEPKVLKPREYPTEWTSYPDEEQQRKGTTLMEYPTEWAMYSDYGTEVREPERASPAGRAPSDTGIECLAAHPPQC